jgi:hypothetical protein
MILYTSHSSYLRRLSGVNDSLVLTTKFLLDYPLPTVAGMKTVLDDLGAKNPKIRELKPEDLLDTRFLRNLKDSGAIK